MRKREKEPIPARTSSNEKSNEGESLTCKEDLHVLNIYPYMFDLLLPQKRIFTLRKCPDGNVYAFSDSGFSNASELLFLLYHTSSESIRGDFDEAIKKKTR